MSEPGLSPNGKKIAAKFGVAGEEVLGIIDIDNPGSPVYIPMRDNDFLYWSWVNDDWLVVRLGDEGAVENYPMYVTRVISIRADGKEVKRPGLREGGPFADVIWIAQDGSPRIHVAYQRSVWEGLDAWPAVAEVDVSTGRMVDIVDPITGILEWRTDTGGTVRFGFGVDNRREQYRVFYRETAAERFRMLDRAMMIKNESLMWPVSLPSKDGKIFVFSDHEGYQWLYELDRRTLTPGKAAVSLPGYDLETVYNSASGDRILGLGVRTNRWRTIWSDPKFASVQASIDKTVPKGQWATIVSWSRDENRFLFHVGNAGTPGSYHLFDLAAGTVRRLGYLNERFKDTQLSNVSTIRYKARDGLEIPAVLTLPRDREANGLPLVLMPHGGPNARDEERWDYWAQFVAHLGYAVIQPNFRGSSGFGTAFANAGDGEWGLKMQDDLNDAVDHLTARGTVDPKRVCIMGGSYGGYAAMRAATRDGERFRCAISINGVSDLVKLNQYDRRTIFGEGRTGWLRKRVFDFAAVSPIHHAAKASTPMLIIHGKEDLRVPVDQSRSFARALERAGKPVRYVELPKADHGLTRWEDRQATLQEVEAFLRQHNGAD